MPSIALAACYEKLSFLSGQKEYPEYNVDDEIQPKDALGTNQENGFGRPSRRFKSHFDVNRSEQKQDPLPIPEILKDVPETSIFKVRKKNAIRAQGARKISGSLAQQAYEARYNEETMTLLKRRHRFFDVNDTDAQQTFKQSFPSEQRFYAAYHEAAYNSRDMIGSWTNYFLSVRDDYSY